MVSFVGSVSEKSTETTLKMIVDTIATTAYYRQLSSEICLLRHKIQACLSSLLCIYTEYTEGHK